MSFDIQFPPIDAEAGIAATKAAAMKHNPNSVDSRMAFTAGAMTHAYRQAIAEYNKLRLKCRDIIGYTDDLSDITIRIAKQTVSRELDPSTLPFVPASAATDDDDDTADFVRAAFGVEVAEAPPWRIPDRARIALDDLKNHCEKVG